MGENNFFEGDVFTNRSNGKNFEVVGPKCPLGEGGFGEVYLVKDLSTDEYFVAKVPNFKKHVGEPKAIDTVKKKQRQEAEIIQDLTYLGTLVMPKRLTFSQRPQFLQC